MSTAMSALRKSCYCTCDLNDAEINAIRSRKKRLDISAPTVWNYGTTDDSRSSSPDNRILIKSGPFSFSDEELSKLFQSVKSYLCVDNACMRICLEMKIVRKPNSGSVTISNVWCNFADKESPLEMVDFDDDCQGFPNCVFGTSFVGGLNNPVWYGHIQLHQVSNEDINSKKLKFQIDYLEESSASAASETEGDSSTTWAPINIESFFQSKEYSDLVIYAGDRQSQIKAHKMVIADRCPVLASMITQPSEDNLTGEIDLADTDPKVAEEFVKFLYTGEANIEEFSRDLLRVADTYLVDKLKRTCEKYLIENINIENVFQVYELGDSLKSETLQNPCVEFLKLKKEEIKSKSKVEFDRFCMKYPKLKWTLAKKE